MQTRRQEVETPQLSAPELLTLLNPAEEAREVLKVGFKELLAQGYLRLEKATQSQKTTLLHLASGQLPANPVLASLLTDLQHACRHSNEMNQVLTRLQAEYGRGYSNFKQKLVLPRLHSLGLISTAQRRWLGLFRSTHYEHTPQGLAMKAALEQDMARARRIASLLQDDPAQVLTLMAGLGAAALLVPELWSHWGEINALLQRFTADGHVPAVGADTASFEEDWKSLEASFSILDDSSDASDGDGGDGGGE